MDKHPLHYFIDLIEGQNIAALRDSFFFVNPELTVITINAQEEYIQHLIDDIPGNEMIATITFKGFLHTKLLEKKSECLTSIDLYFLNTKKEDINTSFIEQIVKTLNYLIEKIKKYPDALKYTELETTLIDLKSTLETKYLINQSHQPTPVSISHTKIKWNAGVASLGTLFYELANNYKIEKTGNSFLTATPDQLKKFILASFVDENGNPFSENSLATYLDSRADKKAKRNRVEADKILRKPQK